MSVQELQIAEPGKSGLVCPRCRYNLTHSEATAPVAACPSCKRRTPGHDSYNLRVIAEQASFLDAENIRTTRWFHATDVENWHETVTAIDASEEVRSFQGDEEFVPGDYSLMVHLGTVDAALHRALDVIACGADNAAARTWYIHEIVLNEDADIAPTICEDDNDVAPYYAIDCGDNNIFGTTGYSATGITRYLNRYEAPGSISLLAHPKSFHVVTTITIEP
jgi:hypothetical protein